MDFDAAIREHADYKVKLVLYLNESGKLDEKRLSKPSSCTLGGWIKQCQKQHFHLIEFKDMVTVHKRFHETAGNILTLIKDGKRYDAKEALGADGIFSEITTELSQKLLLLKRRFAKAG
tara:strand:+ start:999 stop:1355 length:357 start_codon:yes stop_codon:yes gene_type:complete